MPTLRYKPVELVDKPPDGTQRAQVVNADATQDVYVGQIAKLVSGAAVPVGASDTTGFYYVYSDTQVSFPAGGTPNGTGQEIRNFVGGTRPTQVAVLSVSGKRVIVSAKLGTNFDPTTHIGAQKPLVQDGRYTVVDLAGTGTAATILGVVEGAPGDQGVRLLVQLG